MDKQYNALTKNQLREKLLQGACLEDLLPLSDGQECTIFKADQFSIGDEIIYIPDLELNDIYPYEPLREDEIDNTIDNCYTGDNFVELCDGNEELARRLFHFCDWQHPSSALPEVEDDEDKGGAEETADIPRAMASQIIKDLQDLVSEHGDCEIVFESYEWTDNLEDLRYQERVFERVSKDKGAQRIRISISR